MSVSGSSQYLSVIIGHKTMGGGCGRTHTKLKRAKRLKFSLYLHPHFINPCTYKTRYTPLGFGLAPPLTKRTADCRSRWISNDGASTASKMQLQCVRRNRTFAWRFHRMVKLGFLCRCACLQFACRPQQKFYRRNNFSPQGTAEQSQNHA